MSNSGPGSLGSSDVSSAGSGGVGNVAGALLVRHAAVSSMIPSSRPISVAMTPALAGHDVEVEEVEESGAARVQERMTTSVTSGRLAMLR